MSPRPAIFISAVSSELRSARQLIANTLTFLGYEPDWQDIFGTEEGDLRALLRRRIEGCQGVVQLVGDCYGAEPPTVDEQFGRISYTQYEALYAVSKGKKVWYLLIGDHFPTDPHEVEDEDRRKLQSEYRGRVQAESHLYHFLSTNEGLEASVLKLRNELSRLRRGVRRWAAFVVVFLVLIAGLSIWLVESQQHSSRQLETLEEKFDKLQQGVNSFAAVQNQLHEEQPEQKADQLEQRTYEKLGSELGVDPKVLKAQLPHFAQELKKAPTATTYERANAAYVDKDYNEAERLALVAGDEARNAHPPKNSEAVKALELAAWAAEKRIEYGDGLKRLRDAERLTDRTRDPLEWARVQFAIACLLHDQGKYHDAEQVLRQVTTERERVLGPEHPETLASSQRLALALVWQTKYAEAEAEYRAVLKLREKLLGPSHPDTLATRNSLAGTLLWEGKYVEAENELRGLIKLKEEVLGPEDPSSLKTRVNLANALFAQAKYAEAEAAYREVLKLMQKVLGAEHPSTLQCRSNLAEALDHQGKYSEAETEYVDVIKLEEKVLGPEHPDTLTIRSNFAETLDHERRYAEAETEDRAVMKLKEKVLGPENADTLQTRSNLAAVLDHEGKYQEAEIDDRSVIQLEAQQLGPEHPNTLETRSSLAEVLQHEGKYAEAETEDRAVLALREKVLPPDHSDTLKTYFNLAFCLRAEGKNEEATTFAQRAVDGARRILGEEHPETRRYQELAAELTGNGGVGEK
jgi:tetratricopeptide (TPR) repeat protein